VDVDALEFRDPDDGPGDLGDGPGLRLHADGAMVDEWVFHSLRDDLNPDLLRHVLSGVDGEGGPLVLGFEDLLGGGDRDFQDVVIQITPEI
jgi:hypothetical protein